MGWYTNTHPVFFLCQLYLSYINPFLIWLLNLQIFADGADEVYCLEGRQLVIDGENPRLLDTFWINGFWMDYFKAINFCC